MSGSSLALLELVLILAAVFGWGGWQLWSLRREARQRERRATSDQPETPAD